MKSDYPVVRNQPLAKFWYKGSHTHPVRRTVVLIESKPNYLRGYELRDGTMVRRLGDAPVRTYTKKRIARISELDARRVLRARALPAQLEESTLRRFPLNHLVKGV